MSSEPIPCPVAGCDEEFPDMAAAAVHMKEVHKEAFSAVMGSQEEPAQAPAEAIEIPGLGTVSPETLQFINGMMDMKIQAALEAERPQIKAAVTGAIEQVLAQARAAGLPIQGITATGAPPATAVQGSTVTPLGVEMMKLMMGMGSGGGTDIENMTKALTQMRAISDLLNPPSVWDRVMQNVVIRSLGKGGLLTETEQKTLEKDI